jgi:5-oxoprolinase (ATP-hydrolysing) subunit A
MRRPVTIDLNCDLGEGAGHDAELLEIVTTANVCCGAHAGDEATSLSTLKEAARRSVRVGAHPGYLDRKHFGRRELSLSADDVKLMCQQQVGWLSNLSSQAGIRLTHIKPHGALYNQACKDNKLARVLVEVAEIYQLTMLALPDSELEAVSIDRVPFIKEGFADRRYRDDGTLIPRTESNAMIHEADEAIEQAIRLISDHAVESLCVHGDSPHAVEFALKLRQGLTESGISIQAFA